MKIPDLNDLIADLQTAKQIAIDDCNPNAIDTATMSQAKLLGMDNMRDVKTYNDQPVVFNIVGLSPDAALAISRELENEY